MKFFVYAHKKFFWKISKNTDIKFSVYIWSFFFFSEKIKKIVIILKFHGKYSISQEKFDIMRCIQSEKIELIGNNKIKQGNLIYYLNSIGETAYIIGNESVEEDILIPTYIEHENKRYYIISIFKDSFSKSNQIKSIRFLPDSKLLVIGSNSFLESTIESISIESINSN